MANGNIVRSSIPFFFFSKRDKKRIIDAIRSAEFGTSGEIRVHIARRVAEDIMAEAAATFERIGMTRTEKRNGVLIYFAIHDRAFAIIGDSGIDAKAGRLWEPAVKAMQERFSRNEFADGIAQAVAMVGAALKEHFPYQSDDVNELSDKISY
ncbi:MAG: TPM domain-containing protein [Spirochaetota bacterium]